MDKRRSCHCPACMQCWITSCCTARHSFVGKQEQRRQVCMVRPQNPEAAILLQADHEILRTDARGSADEFPLLPISSLECFCQADGFYRLQRLADWRYVVPGSNAGKDALPWAGLTSATRNKLIFLLHTPLMMPLFTSSGFFNSLARLFPHFLFLCTLRTLMKIISTCRYRTVIVS